METELLKSSLRNVLKAYQAKRPHLSIRSIAKNSGVNRYFISKILDKQDQSSAIDLNQTLMLCRYLSGDEPLKPAIQKIGEELFSAVQKSTSSNYLEEKIVDSSRYASLDLEDKVTYFILVLSSYKRGAKAEYVQRLFGERGASILKNLLREGIVVEKSNRIRLAFGNDFTSDFGDLIISNCNYPHEVTKVESGNRKSLVFFVSNDAGKNKRNN